MRSCAPGQTARVVDPIPRALEERLSPGGRIPVTRTCRSPARDRPLPAGAVRAPWIGRASSREPSPVLHSALPISNAGGRKPTAQAIGARKAGYPMQQDASVPARRDWQGIRCLRTPLRSVPQADSFLSRLGRPPLLTLRSASFSLKVAQSSREKSFTGCPHCAQYERSTLIRYGT